ncbi:MAG: tetratricopeptide repeat protein [Candidatus Korarchaeota archaeon]
MGEKSVVTLALLGECQELEKEKNYSGALLCYENILKYDTTSREALLGCARIYYKSKNYSETLSKISILLQRYPDAWEGWILRGKCYFYLNDIDNAMAAFKTVLEINPSNTDALYYVGLLHLWLNQASAAIEYFRKAIELGGKILYKIGLANACIFAKRYDEAEQILNEIVQKRGGHFAHFYLALLHYFENRYNQALEEVDSFISRHKGNGWGLWLKVVILEAMGDYSTAQKVAEKAKRYMPRPHFDKPIVSIKSTTNILSENT